MTFGPRNAYYLRISTNVVLPLFLYLDERHIDWMSDIVWQHVLADLRPLIIPKLQAEKDVHFGLGAAPGNKRGIVEVHRGETYQFAYFFRKTEPHTVLFKFEPIKSRYFVTAPLRSALAPTVASARQNLQNETPRPRVSIKQSKRKRTKSKGKGKSSQCHFGEDEWSAEEGEEHMNDANPIPRKLRPLRKQRRVVAGTYQEDGDDDDMEDTRQDVAMDSPPPLMDAESGRNYDVSAVQVPGAPEWDSNDQLSDAPDVELVTEEEETKPKPLLKLKYQSFPISGHCLCVVVEPWSSLRAEPKQAPLQRGGPEGLLILPSSGTITAGQRAKTPLFLPEYDRAPSEVPFAREKTLPPVPLFHCAMSRTGDDDGKSGDGLMNFSQTLNAAGHMHAIAADEDDDMDGAILFGDADEVRELF